MKIGDLSRTREKMVAKQLKRRGIADERVLSAMLKTPRDQFVSLELAEHAYDDGPLPIGSSQTISQPYIVALMCEAAALNGNERVLEIGTGSGYQAAILAQLAAEIYSIESIPALLDRARSILDSQALTNIKLQAGDGSLGWPEEAPFDAIVVTAAMPGIPRPLLDQLKSESGRLIAPIGESQLQTLVRIERIEDEWRETYFGECRFVPMKGTHGFKS